MMSLVIYVLCMYRSRWEAELVYKSSPVVSLQADLLLFFYFLYFFFFASLLSSLLCLLTCLS